MDEIELIKGRYEKRKSQSFILKHKSNFYFDYYMQSERELIYLELINSGFLEKENIKIIEIGAGNGTNLFFFLKHGIKPDNIYANELLEDRIENLKKKFPCSTIIPGDASQLNYNNEFDIVFQSTVFTSILNDDLKKSIASKMWKMKKEGGIILWYDFIYNNPSNKDVKGIKKSHLNELFPYAKGIEIHKVTLAPFIGRKVGKYYFLINSIFPFLRTHIIAIIK